MVNKWTFRPAAVIAMLACLIVLPGCAGYRLGTMLPPDVKTVFVPTFINETSEPLVEVETTRAVIEQLQLDGSLRIADRNSADAILDVVVHRYELNPVAFDQGRQRTLADEYRLILTARIMLKRRVTDEVLVQNPVVRGNTTFEVTADLPSSKRNALPDAAQDLGRHIVRQVVEVW